ncbi:hypothetical protein HDU76_005245 [Blyttiomyces sp. JEL0837]|nr:hypothetical protein HDU76_005245 [Blyttiomyces sp. JEL0837]
MECHERRDVLEILEHYDDDIFPIHHDSELDRNFSFEYVDGGYHRGEKFPDEMVKVDVNN